LGPEDYGRFGLIVTLTTMIIVLVGNGVPTAMSKYLSEVFESKPGRIHAIKGTALKLQAGIILVLTGLFYALAPLVAWLLRDATLTPLFRLSAFIIPSFALASFYFYYYTGLHYFRLQAILKTLRSLARVLFIVGLGYFFSVQGALFGYIAAPLLVFAVAFLYDMLFVNPTLPPKESEFSFPARTMFQYAWPFTLFLIFYELVLTADLYFVKALLQNDYLTGLYNATITAGRIPYYLFYALTIILLPAVAKSRSTSTPQGHAETKKLIEKTLDLMYIVLLPLVALMAVYGPAVIGLLYGPQYEASVPSFTIFVFGAGMLTVFYVLSFALHGAGRVFIPMWSSFFGALLLSGLNFLWIPHYGISGAALAVSVTSFILMVIILLATKQEFSLSLRPKHFLLSLVSTLVVSFLAFHLSGNHFLFIFWSALLFGAHLAFLFITKVLKPHEFLPFLKKA
jgi:stage V sporulation protein B